MNTNKKIKVILFFILSVGINNIIAQDKTITGRIIDSVNNQNLKDASVSLLNVNDSTLYSVTLAKNEGAFEFKNLPKGKFIIKVSFQGYQTKLNRIEISNIKLQNRIYIYMKPIYNILDSILITASPPLVIIKKDTIEYNAGSFKTMPNDNVEELLRLLPGMQLDQKGEIKINGQKIEQVLVDGKPFFGDNTKVTIKTLPAEIVDKVQVFDKKGDVAAFMGIENGQKTKALNLILKKTRRKGKFGQIGLGLGSQKTYNIEESLNLFNNNRQISFVCQYANVNNSLFSPMNQTPMDGAGIVKHMGGGINYRNSFGNKINVFGNYTYSKENAINEQNLHINNIFPDSITYNAQTSSGTTNNENHRLNLTIENKINNKNILIIRPGFTISHNLLSSIQENILAGDNALTDSIYKSSNRTSSVNNSKGITTSLSFAHKFNTERRAIAINANFEHSNRDIQNYNFSENDYQIIEKIDTLNQLSINELSHSNINSEIVYTEPVGKNQTLVFSSSYRYTLNKNIRNVSSYNNNLHQYNITDSAQSNNYSNINKNNSFKLNYQFNESKYSFNVDAEADIVKLYNNNISTGNKLKKNYLNLVPKIDFNYNFSNEKNIKATYNITYQQPSIEQLQPVTVTSDSLYIMNGNINLKQTHTQNISLVYQQIDPVKQKNLLLSFNASVIKNQIQYSTIQTARGAQIMTPVNTNGAYNIGMVINYGFPLPFVKSAIHFNTNLNYTKEQTILNSQSGDTRNILLSEEISIESAFKNLTINFTANSNFNIATYRSAEAPIHYFAQTMTANTKYIFNQHWTFNSIINITYNGSVYGGNTHWTPIISPGITRQFLKNNRGELKLIANNIFDKGTGISTSINSNTIQYLTTNRRKRFVMLSFVYNFRKFPKTSASVNR